MMFVAELPLKKVWMLGMMILLPSQMNQLLMAQITLVVPVLTQQAQPAPVGAAMLPS